MRKSVFIVVMVLFTSVMHAQQLKDFSLINVNDGKTVSLAGYKSSSLLVVIFMSTECPFDSYYYARIGALIRDYSGKSGFLLVNPNSNETTAAMKKTALDMGLSAPYVADSQQIILQNLNASKTPEIFILKNNGGEFQVVYKGAIDDNAQVESEVSNAYAREALEALLAGKTPAEIENRPSGCSVRKRAH